MTLQTKQEESRISTQNQDESEKESGVKLENRNDKEPEMSIPKKISYCWFGGNPLPEKITKCIESWKKYCPDYEIIRWDETNYDVNKIPFVRDAYKEKKWAFVSDYARLDIIYNQGGIYLDTDVELVKNIDFEKILCYN